MSENKYTITVKTTNVNSNGLAEELIHFTMELLSSYHDIAEKDIFNMILTKLITEYLIELKHDGLVQNFKLSIPYNDLTNDLHLVITYRQAHCCNITTIDLRGILID